MEYWIENKNNVIDFTEKYNKAPKNRLYDIDYSNDGRMDGFIANIYNQNDYSEYLEYKNNKAIIRKVWYFKNCEIDNEEEISIRVDEMINYIPWGN